MNIKKVEMIATPREPHFVGDGFRVHNYIPSYPRMDMIRMDPFIMLDYNARYHFPGSEYPKGVGVHPHRGFETVTIAYKGRIEHRDSGGGGGIIGEGDVQWMTAASGVLHKEFHEAEWSKGGGDFQMVQLWVNLPAKFKMTEPKYQAISHTEMVTADLGSNGLVEVIAGSFRGLQGPANTFTPVHLMNAMLRPGGKVDFSFPENFATGALIIEGKVKVNGSEVADIDQFVLFEKTGTTLILEAMAESKVLILSGEPLLEPIAAHGPFVMNTREELQKAYMDFNTGKFGYLE
ncbi:MAG: pirin family protein [Saprospiraceae bacterium]|nr:pirin family protein [Saprospiraceae bacterium]